MRRPLTAYFSVQDPEKIQSGTMFHHENKGLRSEGKFKSYIDNVKKLRMTSEGLLQKNVDMIDEMYSATPEKIVYISFKKSHNNLVRNSMVSSKKPIFNVPKRTKIPI